MSELRTYSTDDLKRFSEKLSASNDDDKRGAADRIEMMLRRESELLQQLSTAKEKIKILEQHNLEMAGNNIELRHQLITIADMVKNNTINEIRAEVNKELCVMSCTCLKRVEILLDKMQGVHPELEKKR